MDQLAANKVIQQSVVLPAPAEQLFAMFLNPTTHAAITGAPVTISDKPGAKFEAFDGKLTGAVLAVQPPRQIVLAWRSMMFMQDDPDSLLILCFSPASGENEMNAGVSTNAGGSKSEGSKASNHGRIDLIHLGVPDHDFQGVTEGWPKFYWDPWQEYLAKR